MPVYMLHLKDTRSQKEAVDKLADHFEQHIGRKTNTHPTGITEHDFDVHSALEHPDGGHIMIFKAPRSVGQRLKADRVHSDLANKTFSFRN